MKKSPLVGEVYSDPLPLESEIVVSEDVIPDARVAVALLANNLAISIVRFHVDATKIKTNSQCCCIVVSPNLMTKKLRAKWQASCDLS